MPPLQQGSSRAVIIKRIASITILLTLAAVVVLSDTLHAFIYGLIVAVEPVIEAHPVVGALVFVLAAAGSAMLAFFSSALVVPVAVQAWGQAPTLLLLWTGWFLGGVGGYTIGRWLGRPLVRAAAGAERIERYQALVTRHAGFPVILLFQLALPSEVPGYLLGTLRYRFLIYALALALGELPYAIGTVYLGEFFLQRQTGPLIVLGVLGIGFAAWAFHYLHRILRQRGGGELPGSG
jgi:uncharacterized membrane protein YdjX (TVP38/TMEM64 family)